MLKSFIARIRSLSGAQQAHTNKNCLRHSPSSNSQKSQMQTSSSRVTEEVLKNTDMDPQELPTYHPLSHVAKKERCRRRSAENAIHIIPFLLLLSAIILWFFSNSESRA